MVLKLKKGFKIVFSFVMVVVLIFGLLACEDKKKDNKLDMSVVYSDITNSLKLSLDYKGKHFINDGIGLATVRSVADGDTASFILEADGTNFRVRFYGIDTPESTGEVEKWGKASSMFTTNALENAYEVVLESSTGGAAATDSYGERYLAYVWYRNSATDEFKNLNLQLVENGYSPNNCTNTIGYKYYSYFEQAAKFAEKGKLRMWGYAHDEFFSDQAIETNLKELNEDIYAFFNEETQVGSKISLKATVIALEMGKGSDSTHLWTIAQVIDGVVYTYNVYTGYSSSPTSAYLKVGHEYQMTGFIQNHYGKFQISGLEYLLGETGEGYTYRTKASTALVLDDSITYTAKYATNLKAAGTITNVERNGNELTITVTTQTKIKDGLKADVETLIIKLNVEEGYDHSQLLNKKLSGVIYLAENGGYIIPNINDVTFK